MTFGPNHYVPILKAKRGEKKALAMLSPSIVKNATPLFEIVELGEKTLKVHVAGAFKDMTPAVQNFERYFLDTIEIAPSGKDGAELAFSAAKKLGVPFTPVTGISRISDVAAAIAFGREEIALRLTRSDFESDLVRKGVPSFLATHGLKPERIDLVVDLGAVDQMVTPGIVAMTDQFLRDLPLVKSWRTFTLAGCAFPKSMGVVPRNSSLRVERCEWHAWRDHLYARRKSLPRLPTFGDCAIQHPSGVEDFDPKIHQVSAAVRYTLADDWLLAKGQSTRTVPARVQFPKLAQLLLKGKDFAGVTHCAGCKRMDDAAKGAASMGSAEVWRRLGTAHHITRTVEQIQALAWP